MKCYYMYLIFHGSASRFSHNCHVDHYCKSSKKVETPKHSKVGHCTLSASSGSDVFLLEATTEKVVECGRTVNLLSSQYEQIGTAITISERIAESCDPGLKGDGHVLKQGSISAWPIRFMQNVNL